MVSVCVRVGVHMHICIYMCVYVCMCVGGWAHTLASVNENVCVVSPSEFVPVSVSDHARSPRWWALHPLFMGVMTELKSLVFAFPCRQWMVKCTAQEEEAVGNVGRERRRMNLSQCF